MASSSSFTIKVLAMTILLLLIITIIAPTVESSDDDIDSQCDSTVLVKRGACKNNYRYCATIVITALRDVTPTNGNSVYSKSYPEEGAS
ncbi:hypothetical protein LINPERPRIM_LOCUS23450 [Linum perenne]